MPGSTGAGVGFLDVGCAVGSLLLGCRLGVDVGVPGASVGFLLGDLLQPSDVGLLDGLDVGFLEGLEGCVVGGGDGSFVCGLVLICGVVGDDVGSMVGATVLLCMNIRVMIQKHEYNMQLEKKANMLVLPMC